MTSRTLASGADRAPPAAAPGARPAPKEPASAAVSPLALHPHGVGDSMPAAREAAAGVSRAGAPLDPATRAYFEARLGGDLSGVRVHTGPAAASAAERLDALAYTVGRDVAFGAGRFAPATPEGRRLLGHELAHALQWRPGATPEREVSSGAEPAEVEAESASRAAEAGAAVRLGARAQARVHRQRRGTPSPDRALSVPSTRPITITAARVAALFQRLQNGNYGERIPAPQGVHVRLVGIDASATTPMTSIAMEMAGSMTYASPVTGATLPVFGPGNTLVLHLDLARHGLADGEYRFSWTGDARTGTITIEALSAAAAPLNQVTVTRPSSAATGGAQGSQAAQAAPAPSGTTLAVGALRFTLGTEWPQARLADLQAALARIPVAALRVVDGLTFSLGSGAGPVGEDGHYEEARHRVVMFGSAWQAQNTARHGHSTWPVYAIVHEIGHAIDLAPLRAAWSAYSGSSFATARAQATAEARLTAARSESDSRYVQKGSDFELQDPLGGTSGAFRTAATRDGVRHARGATSLTGGPTEYSNKEWQDLYAESFAIYITDPELLQRIRPAVHTYFAGRYPR